MSNIPTVSTYLEFGRSELLKSVAGLSQHELTQIAIYGAWTIKDVLAHIIGWDHHVINILPLILQDRVGELPEVNVEEHNRHSFEIWRDKPVDEVLATVKSTHQQILEIISALDQVEIDTRHDRNDQIITIRSYVVEVMVEHERQHATDITQWRAALEQAIDPLAVKATLAQNRARLLEAVANLSEAERLDQNAVGVWSAKDVIGHLADWERLILAAARHMNDPAQPAVLPPTGGLDGLNETMAAKHAAQPWPEVYQHLTATRQALDEFLASLAPDAWKQRGPFPWPDQGTLAELIGGASWHDAEHLGS